MKFQTGLNSAIEYLQKQENGLHSMSAYQIREAIDTLQVNYELFGGSVVNEVLRLTHQIDK